MTTEIKQQIDAFLEGFRELVPLDLISIFNEQEMELLTCGLPEIEINDLRANAEYRGYTEGSEVIQWFWKIVEEFDREEKALLLLFVTGTSKVPINGFRELHGMHGVQRFCIHRAATSDALLPSAHTCFNQLDLPVYSSQAVLREKLIFAIREGSQGFGFS
eukprot:TRINITY_DN22014_c0_g1_i1.p1 TRINITY_DN22014_c0_g1~~TRINITY_DN22014_c0_g1_i1.p1  ORF type:complete len:161 (+),score=30.71 TRINITY_DN22014_c0_g1_i1:177-659(+)